MANWVSREGTNGIYLGTFLPQLLRNLSAIKISYGPKTKQILKNGNGPGWHGTVGWGVVL